ncbi:MAG: hypothetical protein IKZ07_08495 [Akkermansia sp.]|nr:hypothetical protein [Akkermansia sp.]
MEVPSDYTSHYLADPDDLYDYQVTSGNHAFLLDGSITFTPSSATWWTSSQELKENGSILFTIEEDGDPYSLTFKGGANKAFYNVSTLAIEDIGRVTFEGLKESDYDSYNSDDYYRYYYYYYYYGGAINATTLRLKGNSRVTFTGNEVSAVRNASYTYLYAHGGAIYGADGASITVSETSGAITFAQNKATSSNTNYDAYAYAYGGAIYGGSSSTISIFDNEGDVSFTGNSASASSYYSYSYGGAIYGGSSSTISICDNEGDVSFTSNSAASSSNFSYGGAIYGGSSSTISISGNAGAVNITGNSSSANNSDSYGGAIFGGDYSTISICDNGGDVSFTGNSSSSANNSSHGGAIYGDNYSTISICDNGGDVSFTGNSSSAGDYSLGGAIIGRSSSTISISGNAGAVNITGNSSSSYYSYSSYGGAIYGGSSSTISICDNGGEVNITDNSASSSSNSYGGAIYGDQSSTISISGNAGAVNITGNSASYGGAIYGANSSTITISGNTQNVLFDANNATYGGAIAGDTSSAINLSGSITFSNNDATSRGGAIYSTGQINLNGNITFSGNTATEGGAIYGSEVIIRGNAETVTFSDNSTTGVGAAIYSTHSIYIQDSAVDFSRNYEKLGSDYRLRSIYMESTASDGGHFHLSAAAGKSIEFNDSIYVASGTSGQTVDVIFNGSYTDADSNSIAQSGDIIFDGANVASTLEIIKGSAATEAEISNSLTSYIGGTTHLEAGRLIIRNGAQFNGLGINTTARSGAAVVLQDAGMNHSSGNINLKRGTTLELSGQNAISAQDVTFSGGSTLKFTVDGANRENAVLNLDANLEHFSFTIAVDGAEMLASGRYKLLELASADQYMDLDGYWNADDITVSGTQDAKGASFDNLVWEDGVLYFEQGKSIWSNGSGNALWDSSSENWQRNGADISYRNGMDTVFTDEGAGTVQLVGEISPLSISVENSAGNDYRFEASATGGKITGGSSIVKSGSGELALATANEHTGGTLLQEGTLRVQHSTALGAADATVSTAAGTLLSIENGADVTLSATDNELAGQVAVANGASLQVQSGGYAAESTVLNGNLSFTAGADGSSAGTLSGNGKLNVSGTATKVHFDTISGYSGAMAVSGNGASLSVGDGDYSGSGALSVTDGATLNLSNSAVELKQGGSLSVGGGSELQVESLLLGKGADLLAIMSENSFSLAELSVPAEVNTIMQTDKLIFDGCFADGQALNTVAAGSISATNGLTLQGGSTYTANGTNMNLNGGTLSFEDLSVRINLNLTTNVAELPSDYRIVLFSGVGGLNIDAEYFSTLNTAYVFAASDIFAGDYITADTALVYDSAASVVFLAQGEALVPEPTTATLSLLALAALAARRRRQK